MTVHHRLAGLALGHEGSNAAADRGAEAARASTSAGALGQGDTSAVAVQGAAEPGPADLPFLPADVWEKIFVHLPEPTIARLPGSDRLYRYALRQTFGFDDDAMGPTPRRTLAAACGLAYARRLEVKPVPMPVPPGWVERPEATDEEIEADCDSIGPPLQHFPVWGRGEGQLTAWGTKVAFIAENTPLPRQYRPPATSHSGVAVLDAVTLQWTHFCDLGASAIALGPEGIFGTGLGRVWLMDWSGQLTWEDHTTVPLERLALGNGRLCGIGDYGTISWWDRATGAWIGHVGPPEGASTVVDQLARLVDGFAGGTHDGQLVVWPDGELEAGPRTFPVNAGFAADVTVGNEHLTNMVSCPRGVATGHAPNGLRWRPSLDAPADAAQSWPRATLSTDTLQQVGPALLWDDWSREGRPGTLMRVRLGEQTMEQVADLPQTAHTSIACAGAYYTFGAGKRTLLRVAAVHG